MGGRLPSEPSQVLVVSNRRLDENAGRAEKLATRRRLLRECGWNLSVAYVEPTVVGTPLGVVRNLRAAREADVINSISNPPQLQIAGAILAALSGTSWLAEFRDPLVANPDVGPDSVAASLRRRVEAYVLRHADRVVWYDGIQIRDTYFEREYPDVSETRYRMLPPIGFEAETFAAVEPREFDPLTITYAGSFYEGWIEPYTFLEGLAASVKVGLSDVRAHFYGDWREAYAVRAADLGVADIVVDHPFVPHEEIVSVLKGSDVLLYVGGDDPRNRRNLPSKLYDYVGAQRPILAVVDPDFRVADVIRSNGFGIVVKPGDAEGVRDALDRICSGEFVYDPDPKDIEQFSRERSMAEYVETLETVRDA